MIDIKKIKKDVINYGALKVYEWTVVTTAEAENDELFKEIQLKDIFENKFDVLKLNVEIIDQETQEVLEVLRNQFMKSNFNKSENILCYSSVVDSEEKLTKLIFTKSESAYGVDISEYEVGEGGGRGSEMQSVTYDELKTLRDSALLVPGKTYRITDYECTTIQAESRSAGHQFDIIVTALDEVTLSEEAKAILHAGDTYFANSKLSAWKLWYCFDNDTNRFGWADETNGKGVIYRMIDEWDNDLPYDFKNIQFKRYKVSNIGNPVTEFDEKYFGCKDSSGSLILEGYEIEDDTDFRWCYTFNWFNENGESDDYSIVGNSVLLDEEGYVAGCYKNVFGIMSEYDLYQGGEDHHIRIWLGNNVIIDDYSYDSGLSYGFYCNIIGNSFYNNTIGDNFNSNTIGNDFHLNTIGGSFKSNIIGNNFSYNVIGSDFSENIIGHTFFYNKIKGGSNKNTIGNGFIENIIGNGFNSNIIGNDSDSNTIGDNFYSNTIGNSFFHNTIGHDFHLNTIGNDFYYNTISVNNIKWCIIEDGCQYLNFTTQDSGNNPVQYIHICLGVHGTNESNKLDIEVNRNNAFETIFKMNGSTEVIVGDN